MNPQSLAELEARHKELVESLDALLATPESERTTASMKRRDAAIQDMQKLVRQVERLIIRMSPPPPKAPLRVEADDSVTVATIRKGRNAELRISVTTWMGRRSIDMRVWSAPKDGSETYTPTRKGVQVDAGKLDDIIAGLELARQHL